jgi:hypothetical protein
MFMEVAWFLFLMAIFFAFGFMVAVKERLMM